MQKSDLTISIVNINNCSLLDKCLKSIFEKTHKANFEVFVVDNASRDGSQKMVKEKFPQVRLIENNKNLGFSAANNQVIKESKSKYLLLLNNDTVVLEDALDKMVEFMDKHEDAGALGCKLLNSDGTLQPSCRKFPNLLVYILILLKLHRLFPELKILKRYFMTDFNHQETREVDQVMGACLMMRREAIDDVGLLDEQFFLWFEEIDWCKRVKEKGGKIYFTPEAEIVHYGGKSFYKLSNLARQREFNRSLLKYFKKHHSLFNVTVLKIICAFSLVLSALISPINWLNLKFEQVRS